MKQAPLPTSVAWNGKSGGDFEKFSEQFHNQGVQQQLHMEYLLHDTVDLLLTKHDSTEIIPCTGGAKAVLT